jgi:hypothetical protein
LEKIISWLGEQKKAVKGKGLLADKHFYPVHMMIPDVDLFKRLFGFDKRDLREAYALRDIFVEEAQSPYSVFLYRYTSLNPDPIGGDFERVIGSLKSLLVEHEIEYERREKLVVTQSKKHLYVKKEEGRVLVTGDTFHAKEELKKKGFKWDPWYKAWYKPEKEVDLYELLRELEAL